MEEGVLSTISKISRLDSFETILGIISFVWGIKLYFENYNDLNDNSVFIVVIICLLFIGYIFFIDGLSRWMVRDRKEKEHEDKKREMELKKEQLDLDIKSGKIEQRKKFIRDCRNMISSKDFWFPSFVETSHYSNLKNHISTKIKEDVEKEATRKRLPASMMKIEKAIKLAKEESEVKKGLFDEINKLEKEWDLS